MYLNRNLKAHCWKIIPTNTTLCSGFLIKNYAENKHSKLLNNQYFILKSSPEHPSHMRKTLVNKIFLMGLYIKNPQSLYGHY